MVNIKTKSDLKYNNIVASASFDKEINLDALTDYVKESDKWQGEFELDKNPPVGLRYYPVPEETTLITFHRKGKYVVKGASNIKQLSRSNSIAIQILKETNIIQEDPNCQIQNMVAQDSLERKDQEDLELDLLAAEDVFDKATYEGESYPALDFNPDDAPWSILIYSNGTMIISGCTSPESARKVSRFIKDQINQHV